MRNIFGDQGNMDRNFWEQGNSVKVNFGELLNLFLRNKGTSTPPWEALTDRCCVYCIYCTLLKNVENYFFPNFIEIVERTGR